MPVVRGPDGRLYEVNPAQAPKKPGLGDIAQNVATENIDSILSSVGGYSAADSLAGITAASQAAYGGNAGGLALTEAANAAYGGNAALSPGVTGLGAAGVGLGAALSMPALYYSGLGKKIFGGGNREKHPARQYVAEEVAAANDFGKSFEGFDNLSADQKLSFVKKAREAGTNFITPGFGTRDTQGNIVTDEASKKLPASLFDLKEIYAAKRKGVDQQDNAFRFGGKVPDDLTVDSALQDPRVGDKVKKRLMGLKDLYSQFQGAEQPVDVYSQEREGVAAPMQINPASLPIGRQGIQDLMYRPGRDGPAITGNIADVARDTFGGKRIVEYPSIEIDPGRNPFQQLKPKISLQDLSRQLAPVLTENKKGIDVKKTLNKGKK